MISSDTTINKYKTDGEQAIFSVTYPIYKSTDIKVLLSDGAHAETILLIDTDYTVSINADYSGGLVIMSSPPPSGHILAISLNLPLVQSLDLSSTNTVSTEALETELDKQVQMIQQISDAVNLAVQVPVTSDKTPNQLVDDIFTARDEAQASAEAAAQSATAAEKSAVDAAASESHAKEHQDWSCQCADRAEQARDVALAQAVATNELMAAETSKINAIVVANKDDQQAAIAGAKAWADSDMPPDPNDPESKSAKTWAKVAEENVTENLPTTSKAQKGLMQVGQRLTVTSGGVVDVPLASESEQGMGRSATTAEVESGVTGENGPAWVTPEKFNVSLQAALHPVAVKALGIFNTRVVITTSNAAWTPPVDSWARITVIGGGGAGGGSGTSAGGLQGGSSSFGELVARGGSGGGSAENAGAGGGGAGKVVIVYAYLNKKQPIKIVVGAGGNIGTGVPAGPEAGVNAGGFGVGLGAAGAGNGSAISSSSNGRPAGGPGGLNGTGYGGGGGGYGGNYAAQKNPGGVAGDGGACGLPHGTGAGGNGAVIIEYFDPDKEAA